MPETMRQALLNGSKELMIWNQAPGEVGQLLNRQEEAPTSLLKELSEALRTNARSEEREEDRTHA